MMAPLVKHVVAAAVIVVSEALPVRAADPVVSNVRASQRPGTKLVDIYYDLAASTMCTVTVAVSTNGGATYDLPVSSFTGDIGSGVLPGTDKAIVWDAGADWGGRYSTQLKVKISASDGFAPSPPPDPSTIANTPENGVVSLLCENVAFLYSGTNAIQTGVATGTIQALQAAVLKGRVQDANGAPLPAVTITVNQHPEFGQTLTRTNGEYDLVVNGGGVLNLNFRKTGYLPVQRTLDVPWQDYLAVEDVVLMTSDTNVSVLTLPSTNMQAAYGSVITDGSINRRAVVLVPAGVTASIFAYDGSTQQVGTLTTRFTEFTVGSNGPSAMPGDLPPQVAYTYCISLNADEAQAKVAGKDVVFSSNVYFYVDNFLEFPAGLRAPIAYYDDEKGAWVPTPDGCVLQLIGTNAAGLARVSVNTNGTEADAGTLAVMGLTDAERLKLTEVYPQATNSLWRVPMAHFSTKDVNLPLTPMNDTPPNIDAPNMLILFVDAPLETGDGGALEMENQSFAETCPVAGTPFTLHYNSRRMPGNLTTRKLTIPLIGTNVPAYLQRIELGISVAGRDLKAEFPPVAGQTYEYTWDGKDAYGRLLVGYQPAVVQIAYLYPSYYAIPLARLSSFGWMSGERIPGGILARESYPVCQTIKTMLCHSQPAWCQGLCGWTFGVHHAYDPVRRCVLYGNGTSRGVERLAWSEAVVSTFAGNGATQWVDIGDGGPATNAVLQSPEGCAVDAAGRLIIADTMNGRIRRVDTNGVIATLASTFAYGVTHAPDGSIYFSDGVSRVKRLGTNGVISVVAGNGAQTYAGDGGPATNASLWGPMGLAVAQDGSVYIADLANNRIRRVAPDGSIGTVAGKGPSGGSGGFSGDGGPATNASLSRPRDVALGPDGALYIADDGNNRVRKVGIDGIITTCAGTGTQQPVSGDGGPATNANVGPYAVAVAPDGTLFILEWYCGRVRRVGSDGIIQTLAGSDAWGYSGDGGPAAGAQFKQPKALALAPDGALYVADTLNDRIRRIAPYLPSLLAADNFFVPSEDGALKFEFTQDGRHLRTVNALTGSNVYTFAYTTNGHLASITDGYGNTTEVQYDAAGRPAAIKSPFGQTSTLTIDANGFLATIVNPKGEATSFGYTPDGLLTNIVGAKGAAFQYRVKYNADGCVLRIDDPAGGYNVQQYAALSNGQSGFNVACTSAMGRVQAVAFETLSSGAMRRIETFPDGSSSEEFTTADGVASNRAPAGTVVVSKKEPDPRFGMAAPLTSWQITRLPSGLSSTSRFSRACTAATLTDTQSRNGRVATRVYTYSSRLTTATSAAGRQAIIVTDGLGKPLVEVGPGEMGATNTYDGKGRLESSRVGERIKRYAYGPDGYLAGVVDALGYTNLFCWDAIGRMTNFVLPNGYTVRYTYDAHGNRTSVTPPGRSAYTFQYSPVDLMTNFIFPDATHQVFDYNADRQLVRFVRGGGQVVTFGFDSGGRPGSNYLAGTTVVFKYMTNGLRESVSTIGGVRIAYQYDGSMVTRIETDGAVTGSASYAYDNDFRPALEYVNDAFPADFGYDADGLLTNAGLCRLERAAASGLRVGSSLSNVTDTIAYNAYCEPAEYAAYTNGGLLFGVTFQRDNLGRITNAIETINGVAVSTAYRYDPAGRLVSVATNGTGSGTNSYSYDANGNLTNWSVNGTAGWAEYDGLDRLLKRVAGTATNTYQYNAAGDLTNKTTAAGAVAYSYDGGGNLLSVTLPGGASITYCVDGFGRRIAKYVNGVFTQGFVYGSGMLPLAELDAQSNVVSRFVYGGGGTLLYMIRGGAVYRIVCDHLGSPRLVVEAGSGAVAQRLDYDVWGMVLSDTAQGFQPFGFAGGLYDPDTGLVRFGARDYDAEASRWTATDPLLFKGGGFNLYIYNGNDPVNLVDSMGAGPGYSPNWNTVGTGLGQIAAGGVGMFVSFWITTLTAPLDVTPAAPATIPLTSYFSVGMVIHATNVGIGFGNVLMGVLDPDAPVKPVQSVPTPGKLVLQFLIGNEQRQLDALEKQYKNGNLPDIGAGHKARQHLFEHRPWLQDYVPPSNPRY